MKITDEMVEAACVGWTGKWGHDWPGKLIGDIGTAAADAMRETMRCAFEAAIAAAPLGAVTVERCAEVAEAAQRHAATDTNFSNSMNNAYAIQTDACATAIRALPTRPPLNPLTEAPKYWTWVWIVNHESASQFRWTEIDWQKKRLAGKFVYGTQSDADEHVRRMAEVRGCK